MLTLWNVIWFILIFVVITGYFILDGFDLGVGALYPFLGKDEVKKDYKQALQWYEKYLEVARPGTQGYEFATKSVTFLKGELFMEEP